MLTSSRQTPPIVILTLALLVALVLTLGLVIARVSHTISLVIVGGILVFILSFVSTQFALYILIFATLLSPEFGSRGTSGGGATIRLDDLWLLIVGFSQLVRSAVHKVGLFSSTPLNKYITYYMMACAVSTIVGMLFGRVKLLTGFFFVLKYFEYYVVYFMLINNLHTKEQAKRFLVAIFLTAAIVSLVAMAQIPSGGRISAPFEGESGEPNTLGGYLLLISSIVGGLLMCQDAVRSRTHRMALLSLGGLMFIPILFTGSRATWLALFPVYLAFLILGNKKALLAAIGLISLVAAPLILPESVKERIFYTVEVQESKWARQSQEQIGGMTLDTSTSARIQSWKSAIDDFPRHPIIGFGITGWRFIDAQYFRVLLETGLVGFATFSLLLWAILRETWHNYRSLSDPFFKGIALGFLVGVIGMIVHAMTANTFIIVRIMEPFWLLAAIVVAAPALEEEQEKPQPEALNMSTGTRGPRMPYTQPERAG